MSRICSLFLGTGILLLSGCASPPPGTILETVAQDPDKRTYQIKQAEILKVAAVGDDGQHTFVEFDFVVPSALKFFGTDGQALRSVRSGRVVAVDGLHDSILIGLGPMQSLVRVADPALKLTTYELTETDEIQALKAAIRDENQLAQDFSRAVVSAYPMVLQSLGYRRPANQSVGDPAIPGAVLDDQIDGEGKVRGKLIRFSTDNAQPIDAQATLDPITAAARVASGVIVIRGLVPAQATQAQESLAMQRAQVIANAFINQGLRSERVVVARNRPEAADPDSTNSQADSVEVTFISR